MVNVNNVRINKKVENTKNKSKLSQVINVDKKKTIEKAFDNDHH